MFYSVGLGKMLFAVSVIVKTDIKRPESCLLGQFQIMVNLNEKGPV